MIITNTQVYNAIKAREKNLQHINGHPSGQISGEFTGLGKRFNGETFSWTVDANANVRWDCHKVQITPTFKQVELFELIEALKRGDSIYYHAPMDHSPCLVRILQYTVDLVKPKCNTRATISGGEIKALSVNLAKHLDRFRLRLKPSTDES